LGIEESEGIHHQQMKERLIQEYRRRLRIIPKSELNARNKITATGALAVPILRYSFGIINWKIEEIKQIDRKTRKTLTMYKMHHPKADIDRLYVKRKEGGRGLAQVEAAIKAEIINIAEISNSLRPNRQKRSTNIKTSNKNCTEQMQPYGTTNHVGRSS
jgi:predicted GNAT family acetyltransferase